MSVSTAAAPETKIRHVGNCQICEADQKLHKGALVHHGYRRPGHGFIEGDCPGVGEPPYEVSCEALKAYKVSVEEQVRRASVYLARLIAREVTSLTEVWQGAWTESKITFFYLGVTAPHLWERAYEREVGRVKRAIGAAEGDAERCERRITAWKPAPLRTVEEEAVKSSAKREERARATAERRAARQADEERKRQKRAALEAKRQAVKDGFVARLVALVEPVAGVDVDAEKKKILSDLRLKKHDFIWGLRGLQCEEICIQLGLARRDDTGWVHYAD